METMAPSYLFVQRYSLPAIALPAGTTTSTATATEPAASAASATTRLLGTRFIHRQQPAPRNPRTSPRSQILATVR